MADGDEIMYVVLPRRSAPILSWLYDQCRSRGSKAQDYNLLEFLLRYDRYGNETPVGQNYIDHKIGQYIMYPFDGNRLGLTYAWLRNLKASKADQNRTKGLVRGFSLPDWK